MTLRVHAVSPQNEMPVARRLEALIRFAWPDIDANLRDHIDILVGVRSPAEIDLLVIVDLDRPRELAPQRRRGAGASPAASVRSAFIAIEVKQLDSDRFERIGNQLIPRYDSERGKRSVVQQALDAAYGLGAFARQSGVYPFIHALAWLTELDEAMLGGIEPIVLGGDATWLMLLDAALQQHPLALEDARAMAQAVQLVRERLLNRRKDSSRDVARIERLSRDLAAKGVVDALVARAGTMQIRLQGRGGSGKTTSLALLATRLAEGGERVLILTFHRTLRTDIAHLIGSLLRPTGIRPDRVQVETTMGFLLSALSSLGAEIPLQEGGAIDYTILDRTLDETRALLIGEAGGESGDAARLRRENPERFAWDYVLIDEAQDWTDAERDFVRALYGHRRLILADGLDQLVRRQFACDWNVGIPVEDRVLHRLDDSLRMLRNVATFANCTAHAMGFDSWRIIPREELAGGRILIVNGDVATPAFVRALVAAAAANKADPVDCLVCVPPSAMEVDGDGTKRAHFAAVAAEAGIATWDGTDPALRGTDPSGNDAIRIVQYDSCRGLEGWITVALDLDELYLNKVKHPNLHPGDPVVSAELVAQRWLLIPLTRAVHTLIISLRDPDSAVARSLREACEDPALPSGVVEWVDVAGCIERLAPLEASV